MDDEYLSMAEQVHAMVPRYDGILLGVHDEERLGRNQVHHVLWLAIECVRQRLPGPKRPEQGFDRDFLHQEA